METDSTRSLSNVFLVDGERTKDHLKHIVRDSVEATLNASLVAEAKRSCQAGHDERTPAR